MTAPFISNLAGTMSESFAIGKRGVKLLQGNGAPTGVVAPLGSLYLRKDIGYTCLYQLGADDLWVPLPTMTDVQTAIAVAIAGLGQTNQPGQPSELPTDTSTVANAIAAEKHRRSFTNADLVAGVLTVQHNLNEDAVLVQVWNDSKRVVMPDGIQSIDGNNIAIDLSSYGTIAGTWKVFITR